MSAPNQRSWLKPFLNPLKPVFREVLAMSAFVNLLALGVPLFTMQVYDRVVAHAGISTLWGLLIGMIFVVIFDLLLKHSRSRIMQTVALRVDVLVGRQLFNKFVALPLHVLESKPASHWQSLFRDVDVVRNTLSGASALLMADLPFALLFFSLIVVIAPPLSGVLLLVIPVFMFVAWKSGNTMAQANRAERATTQNRDSLIAEMIAGRATIKALALDQSMRPIWEAKHAENIEQSVIRGSKTDFFSNLGSSLTMVTSLLLTSVGAYYIVIHQLTMGALVATNMLSSRLLGPLNQLVAQWRTYSSFKQSVERLGEVFSMESEREVSEVKLERPRGEIRLENVTFAYGQDMAPVVDDVTLTIRAGGVHALVGRNGSGKTTVMKLVQGLYKPVSGRVLLDGADIAQFTRIELAHWMGYVPQESVLFAGTVRDNIIHRFPKATDDEIIRASTQAGVHQFIIDLPDGYGTEIGEAGQRLSGGQRQRIAIARALVGDPPVLLMDEPSSSLDRQAEQELQHTLIEIGRQRTVIIITHSPILLSACDDLVALDRGKVALAGPSKEILPRLFGQAPKAAPAASPAPAAAKALGGRPGPAPAGATPAPPRAAPAPVRAASAPKPVQAGAKAAPAPAAAPVAAARLKPAPRPAPAPAPAARPKPAPRPAPSPVAPAAATPRPAPVPRRDQVAAGAAREAEKTKPPTADPSVPGGTMFRLPDGGQPSDDPYAELLGAGGGGGKRPTARPRN